jgi:hypothetical protein
MDKFSQLIIEAYRNQNFRFAEDPETASEPEIVAPPALDYSGLFTKLQSLDDTKKIKVYTNLKRARIKLKLNYNIDSQLPIKLDSTKSPAEYSDNSNSNTDEKIQTYFYRVFEYLVNYFENEASSTLATETTTETEESSSAVGTAPSSDSSSGETSATTETTSSGETTATTNSDTSKEPAENIPPITIKVSGKEYFPAESITLVNRINIIGSNPKCSIVLEDESVTDFNCVIQFKDEKWILSKQADSTLAYNGEFVDEFSVLNVGDYFVPGTRGIYILSVKQIGTDNGGLFGSDSSDDSESNGGFFGSRGGGRRR